MHRKPDILFLAIDTQIDLIDPSGALPVPGAAGLGSNLSRLTQAGRAGSVPIVATALDHHPADQETDGQPDFRYTFPPHCLHGTKGQEMTPETALPEARLIDSKPMSAGDLRGEVEAAGQQMVLLKSRFDPFRGSNLERLIEELRPKRIVAYGVPLDQSVRFTIDGLVERGHTDLALVTDATAGFDPDRSADLLAAWEDRGLDLATTDQVLAAVGESAPVRRSH